MLVRKLKRTKWFETRLFRILAIILVMVLVATSLLMFFSSSVRAVDDYTFDQENVTDGYSTNAANKNTEDATYNELLEEDLYADTNFSGSNENVVVGTGGGGTFPEALNTDDATYRSYTEADGGLADTTETLVPTSDIATGFDTIYPVSPTTHYDKVDDGASHDSADTYCRAVTNADQDIYGLGDMADPGTADLDVTIHIVCQDAGTGFAYLDAGVYLSSTCYVGVNDQQVPNSWTEYTYTWETNPDTSAEWAYGEINGMGACVAVADAAPDVDVTSVWIVVSIDYASSYTLDVQLTYSSVTSTGQTISYSVLCQAYRGGTEDFLVYAWNYTSSAWVLKTTVNQGSATDFNFDLLTAERDGVANEVKFRIIGNSEVADGTQDVVYFDLLKVKRLEKGYGLDVDISSTTVAAYGNITLRIKGYTSAEQFNVNVWNYSSAAYDVDKIAITDLANAWQTTLDLCDAHHRSGSTVKIQFTDETASTADTTQDTLYIDVAWVTRYHTDPTITLFGTLPTLINEGETAYFWANYTDYDNEAPTTMQVHIDASDYNMDKNGTDVSYHNGVNYSYSTAALTNGNWTYYFKCQDANSGVVTSSSAVIAVNALPTLTGKGVNPATGLPGTFSFYVTYTDEDDNAPAWVRVTIDGAWFEMTGNVTNDGDFTNGENYYYEKVMAAGTHPYLFWTQDYNSGNISTVSANLNVGTPPVISDFGVLPTAVTVGTEVTFFATYTDDDNNPPLYFDLDINGLNWNMLENNSGDTTYTDGKAFYLTNTNLTAGNYTCFFKTMDSGSAEVTSTSFTLTINTLPTLTGGGILPLSGNSGDTFQFSVIFTDANNHMPNYIQVNVDTVDFDMVALDGGDSNTVDGKSYYYDKPLAGGSHDFYFKTADYLLVNVQTASDNIYVNNIPTLSAFGRLPADPVYVDTTLNFTVTLTDIDGDLPTAIKWRENDGAVQNLSMSQVDSVDVDTTDGKDYYITLTLGHGAHNYDFYATDGTGHVMDGDNTVTIVNRVPVITDQPADPTNTYRNTYWEYDCEATDADLDSLVWDISTNCTTLTVNPATGVISGTTPDPVAGYLVYVWCNDSYSGSDTYNFWLWALNRVPVISSSGNTTQAYDTFLSYTIVASDGDTDVLTYELSTNASWASIASNVVSGTANVFGWFNFDVWVNDSYGGSDTEHWVLTVGNTNPYFTSTPDYWGINNTAYSYDADATDPEGLAITYGLSSNASFLSIHATLGYVNGTPDLVGSYWVNVSAFDGANYAYSNFTLGINNTAPIITSTPITNGQVGTTYQYDANATDDNGDDLYYDIASGPVWAGIDHATGEITGMPPAAGNYDFNISVYDGYVLVYDTWTLIITDPAAPPVEPEAPTDEEDYGASFYARFTYLVNGMTVVVEDDSIGTIQRIQWSFGDGTGSPDSRVVHTYDSPGTYVITLTIYGTSGEMHSVQVEVTVADTPGWYIDKTQVGWLIVTPIGSFEWGAVVSVMIGVAILIMSFGGQRFSWIRPKTFRAIGIILLVVGVLYYAL